MKTDHVKLRKAMASVPDAELIDLLLHTEMRAAASMRTFKRARLTREALALRRLVKERQATAAAVEPLRKVQLPDAPASAPGAGTDDWRDRE
jgi:hypothetical protein